MKIIFLVRLFFPHDGGVEKHVYKISKELQKKGHQIVVITERYDKKLKISEEFSKIQIYRIPIGGSEFSKKFEVWYWILKNKGMILSADIIHAHDVAYWFFPLKFISPQRKFYTTFHGYEGNNIPNFRKKIMLQLSNKLSHRTIGIGSFYKKWFGFTPDIVSFGAVDNKSLSEQKKDSAKLQISFVGRLEYETGIKEYIQALKVLDKKIKLYLDIYGDGSLIKYVNSFISKNNLPATIHGWVKSPEDKIKSSDLVFTSRYLGILESLANRKFVVAVSSNKIKKDYLKMTPFAKYIFITSSIDKISEIVLDYMNRPKKFYPSIEKGSKWAREQTWKKLTTQYLALWS